MVHKIRKIRKKNITSGSESLNKIYFNKNTHALGKMCVCRDGCCLKMCELYIEGRNGEG